MMRKIHRIALAAKLKAMLPALAPAFLPAKADVAKALDTERRFTFCADYPAGRAFLLFYPAASATDDYFTVEVAWIAAPLSLEALNAKALQMAILSPWKDCSREEILQRPSWRLRLEDLWTDAPPQHTVFRFNSRRPLHVTASRCSPCTSCRPSRPGKSRHLPCFRTAWRRRRR